MDKVTFGYIISYNRDRGFGFIRSFFSGRNYFFHISNISDYNLKKQIDEILQYSKIQLFFEWDKNHKGYYVLRILNSIKDIPLNIIKKSFPYLKLGNSFIQFQELIYDNRFNVYEILELFNKNSIHHADLISKLINTKKRKIRDNYIEFNNILENYNITHLYHFTDKSNIDSIKSYGGLYSWFFCDNFKIQYKPGGNSLSHDLDERKGLQDYVRLSFNKHHPMMRCAKVDGRSLIPIILSIKKEIIFLEDTLFSNINATDNNSKCGSSLDDFKKINFEIAHKDLYNVSEKKFYQAEVLVKSFIPLEYIEFSENDDSSTYDSQSFLDDAIPF